MRCSRRIAAVTLAVGMLVVLPACGKTNEAARAAGITPTNALGFVSMSLDPSIEQKANLLSIAKKFPRAKITGDFNHARDDLLRQLVKQAGLDFAQDVKPWLGTEVALVVVPGAAGKKPGVVVLIQEKDEAKARAALAKASKKTISEGQKPPLYRFVKGFAVAADQTDQATATLALDAIEQQSKKTDGGLAKSAAFTKVVNDLHGDRLLLGWINTPAAVDAISQSLKGKSPIDLTKFAKGAGPVAVDLHAEHAAIVLEGVGTLTKEAPVTGAGDPTLTAGLPADSFGAFTIFDLGASLGTALQQVAGLGGNADLNKTLGLDLQADILSWMGGESVLVAGPAPAGSSIPSFGFLVQPTDMAKATAAVAKIRHLVESKAGTRLKQQDVGGVTAYVFPGDLAPGVQPAFALFNDRFVIASNPTYLATLSKAANPSLASTSGFKGALGSGSGDKTQFQLLLQIGPIREAIEKLIPAADRGNYDREVKPNLEPIDSVGISVRKSADLQKFELKTTFK